jgi:periplasmic divalent cation tolerance protein
MTLLLQVVTTTSTPEEAQRIARELVQRRLAACVQIEGPLESCYWWDGKIEQAREYRFTAKTRAEHYRDVEALIRQLHSYDEPEIVAVEIVQASPSYRQWVLEQTDLSGKSES